jgi:SAM-dependent methyltransferase
MSGKLSPRLAAIVDALPLRPGLRVLEIGCGTGAAAAEVARRIGRGHVLAIDRSSKAIAQARAGQAELLTEGRLEFRQAAAEELELKAGEQPYDFAFAVRVGALDGRHPEVEAAAKACIKKALKPGGKLFIDGGSPLKAVNLDC